MLCKNNFPFTQILHESFVRIFHVTGKLLQDSECCMNLLSETSLRDTWIFHLFQQVCPHAWMQHLGFPDKVNSTRVVIRLVHRHQNKPRPTKAGASNAITISWAFRFSKFWFLFRKFDLSKGLYEYYVIKLNKGNSLFDSVETQLSKNFS